MPYKAPKLSTRHFLIMNFSGRTVYSVLLLETMAMEEGIYHGRQEVADRRYPHHGDGWGLLGRSKRPENSARPDNTARTDNTTRLDNTARTDNTTRPELLGLYCDQLSEIRTGGRADRRGEELVSR